MSQEDNAFASPSVAEHVKAIAQSNGHPSAAAIFGEVELEDGRPIITITVQSPKGVPFNATFELNDEKTQATYSSIYTGGLRKKKGDPVRAIHTIFDKKFIRTNIGWEGYLQSKGFATEKEFFQKDPVGQLYLDAMVNGYLGERPEVQDLNE